MKRPIALLIALALVQGCVKQAGEKGNLLDLEDQPSRATAGTSPVPVVAPSDGAVGGSPTAVLVVARALAARRGADSVEIGRFCDGNSHRFTSEADVQACKSLARSPVALVPAAATIEEMATIAATLPVKDRFVFCTSTATLKLTRTVEDYDRCFPPTVRAEFEAMGGIDGIEAQDAPVTQEELKEQVMRNAGLMTESERQLYCNVASVRATMEGDSDSCMVGPSPRDLAGKPLTDDDPGYRDEGR